MVTGDIESEKNDIGGLVGLVYGGSLHNVWADSRVQGRSNTGGLVGYLNGGNIRLAYTLGSVQGSSNVGGLVGRVGYRPVLGTSRSGHVIDSYSRASVSGEDYVGGLVGHFYQGSIQRTYSTGLVTGTGDRVGGLVGQGSATNSYWDTETSGQESSAGGEGRTTGEMQKKSTFPAYNFLIHWQVDEGKGYPVFRDISGYDFTPLPPVELEALQGSGTLEDPYIITKVEELNAVRQDLEASYRLANDLDLTDSVVWNNGRGWRPIGTSDSSFTGTFDGNNHTISNLHINTSGGRQGLFGHIEDASLLNINLENVQLHGGQYTGALVGYASDSIIQDCTASGFIASGRSDIGGLVGHARESTIEHTSAACTIYSSSGDTGGLVGLVYGGSLHNVWADSRVQGRSNTGGLVGYLNGGNIRLAYTLGSVQGSSNVGGLVGRVGYRPFLGSNRPGHVIDSYSRASVSGVDPVGGLVGYLWVGSIQRTYSTGLVTGTGDRVGGLVGQGSATNSYWDTETSGQEESAGGEGRTTAEMTYPYAGDTYQEFDFQEVWAADTTYLYNQGYPYLQGLTYAPAPGKYSLILEANPAAGGRVTGMGAYAEGEEVTVTAIPEEGYLFENWKKDDQIKSSDASFTYTMPAVEVTLVANFVEEEVAKYTLDLQADPPEGGTVSGVGEYEASTTVTLTATPAEGWLFQKWVVNGTEFTGASISVVMDADKVAKAYFIEIDPGEAGEVYSFGRNLSGQLGLGDTEFRHTPTRVSGLPDIQAVTTGCCYSLALAEGGQVYAFGWNTYGQLGLGDTDNRHNPVPVPELSGIKDLAAGSSHSFALTPGGEVYSFGRNFAGQLGLGDTTDRHIPTRVPGLSSISSIAAGGWHVLALAGDGKVYAFGRNNQGQLGLEDTGDYLTPVSIPGLSGIRAVAAGFEHSLALTEGGEVYAFGLNTYGQLGLGDTVTRYAPVKIPGLKNIRQVAAGYRHSLVLTEGGEVYAFGQNLNGCLGLGDQETRHSPEKIPGLSNIRNIAAGQSVSLALTEEGHLYSFGYNAYGNLGLGDTAGFRFTPNRVPGFTGIRAVSAFNDHTLILAGPREPVYQDHEAVAGDKAWLEIGYAPGDDARGVTGDLVLPTEGPRGSIITWHSDNPDVVNAGGTVGRPAQGEGDVEVTLTATITRGGYQETRNFVITVKTLLPDGFTLTLAADPPEGGTVSGAGEYEAGTTVTLTATPAEGWQFVKWVIDGNEYNISEIPVTMNRHQGAVAFFEEEIPSAKEIDNLRVVEKDADRVVLAWEPLEGAESYNIYRVPLEIPVRDECFIATAAYGSSLSPAVSLLRQFRDIFLLSHETGTFLVEQYYEYSPTLAGYIRGSEILQGMTRVALLPFILLAYLALNYQLALTTALLAAFLLAYLRWKKHLSSRTVTISLLVLTLIAGLFFSPQASLQAGDNPSQELTLLEGEWQDTTYTDEDILPGGTYKYKVTAVSGGQEIAEAFVEVKVPETETLEPLLLLEGEILASGKEQSFITRDQTGVWFGPGFTDEPLALTIHKYAERENNVREEEFFVPASIYSFEIEGRSEFEDTVYLQFPFPEGYAWDDNIQVGVWVQCMEDGEQIEGWRILPHFVDREEGLLIVPTDHFSDFAVASQEKCDPNRLTGTKCIKTRNFQVYYKDSYGPARVGSTEYDIDQYAGMVATYLEDYLRSYGDIGLSVPKGMEAVIFVRDSWLPWRIEEEIVPVRNQVWLNPVVDKDNYNPGLKRIRISTVGNSDLSALQATVGHELFHRVQNYDGYLNMFQMGMAKTIMEITAEYAGYRLLSVREGEDYENGKRNLQFIDHCLLETGYVLTPQLDLMSRREKDQHYYAMARFLDFMIRANQDQDRGKVFLNIWNSIVSGSGNRIDDFFQAVMEGTGYTLISNAILDFIRESKTDENYENLQVELRSRIIDLDYGPPGGVLYSGEIEIGDNHAVDLAIVCRVKNLPEELLGKRLPVYIEFDYEDSELVVDHLNTPVATSLFYDEELDKNIWDYLAEPVIGGREIQNRVTSVTPFPTSITSVLIDDKYWSEEESIARITEGIQFIAYGHHKGSSVNMTIRDARLALSIEPEEFETTFDSQGESKVSFTAKVENIPERLEDFDLVWDFGDGSEEKEQLILTINEEREIFSQITHTYVNEGDLEEQRYDVVVSLKIGIGSFASQEGQYIHACREQDIVQARVHGRIIKEEKEETPVQVSILPYWNRNVRYVLEGGVSQVTHDFEARAHPGGTYRYDWDFGDGGTFSEVKGTGEDSQTSHTYTGLGDGDEFSPVVSLYSADGELLQNDSIRITIVVKEPCTIPEDIELPEGWSCDLGIDYTELNRLDSLDTSPYTIKFTRDGVDHGLYIRYYDDMQIREIGCYKDGEKYGTWLSFTQDGVKYQEETYYNNQRHGVYRGWTVDGILKQEGSYQQGKRSDTWVSYRGDGSKVQIVNFMLGQRHGLYMEWFENGNIREESSYAFGEYCGTRKLYREDGSIIDEYNWLNGKRHGEHTRWYANGNIEMTGEYTHGLASGTWLSYYEDGTLKEERARFEGKNHGPYKAYYGPHLDGILEREGQYCHGNFSGKWKYYHTNGHLSETRTYPECQEDGVNVFTYYVRYFSRCEENRVTREGQYKDSHKRRDGLWIDYFSNGSIRMEINWLDGNLHGTSKYYYSATGTLSEVVHYEHGKLHGPYTKYYDTGEIEETGQYQDGNKVGVWTRYDKDGTAIEEEDYGPGDN